MRTHAAIGAEILRGISLEGARVDMLTLAHEIAWTHHERWDGTGYPRGLAGAAIPLAGRIMALVDCYDALTSERPYKHAWPHAAAIAYLAEQRGKAFDPELVDSLMAREPELAEVVARLRGAAANA
jgi:putative two-component system response regulator